MSAARSRCSADGATATIRYVCGSNRSITPSFASRTSWFAVTPTAFGRPNVGPSAFHFMGAPRCAIFSTLKKGDTWTTLELKINYVRALTKDTGPVRAEGRVIHRGKRVATSEGDLKDREGKLYAHASTTCMIFPAD